MTTEQVIGKYQWVTRLPELGSTIELKADQTFEYNWQTGLILGTTFGTWEREGTKITLNSKLQPNKNCDIIKKSSRNQDFISLHLIFNNEVLPFAETLLISGKDTLYGKHSDLDGNVQFPKTEADSITIRMSSIKNASLPLRNVKEDYFEISLRAADYRYLSNKEFVLKKGRLYDYTIKTDEWVNNYYIKSTTGSNKN